MTTNTDTRAEVGTGYLDQVATALGPTGATTTRARLHQSSAIH